MTYGPLHKWRIPFQNQLEGRKPDRRTFLILITVGLFLTGVWFSYCSSTPNVVEFTDTVEDHIKKDVVLSASEEVRIDWVRNRTNAKKKTVEIFPQTVKGEDLIILEDTVDEFEDEVVEIEFDKDGVEKSVHHYADDESLPDSELGSSAEILVDNTVAEPTEPVVERIDETVETEIAIVSNNVSDAAGQNSIDWSDPRLDIMHMVSTFYV